MRNTALLQQQVFEINEKIRHVNMLLCAATNIEESPQNRLEYLQQAFDAWPKGSFEHARLQEKYSDLKLKLSSAAASHVA